ncbi:MAG: WbqC family protein [Flavobacteriaceae bacterium]|nr:WbqC family protein [Flavobacteriaceae bacterium]
MKIAVMQPYLFPYLGYFQLVNSVDKFVFYDDVNFIKRGWINRNRILVGENPVYFTMSLENASQNKLINEISLFEKKECIDKIIKTITQNYKKAPYFQPTIDVVQSLFEKDINSISELAIESVRMVSDYLDINTDFLISSKNFPHTRSFERADRLIQIAKELDGETYINAIGGQELYEKSYFKDKGLYLYFLNPQNIVYSQFEKEFQPHLSIIDVMMHNSLEDIKRFLNQYDLI